MAKKLAIANQKGGVGKTTLAVSLATGWARQKGARVLLADLDPQANATLTLLGDGEIEPNLYDVLMPEEPGSVAGVIQPVKQQPGLDILPSSLELADAERQLLSKIGGQTRLRSRLAEVESNYDVIVLDLPPSLGLLCVSGLAAANEVLIPVLAGEYSRKGLHELMLTVKSVIANLGCPDLVVRGIVLNMADRTHAVQTTRQKIDEEYPGLLLRSEIPRSVRVVEASAPRASIFDHQSTVAAIAFGSLLEELDA